MTGHWIFIIPIAYGYLFSRMKGMKLGSLRALLLTLMCFLFAYNITLFVRFFQ